MAAASSSLPLCCSLIPSTVPQGQIWLLRFQPSSLHSSWQEEERRRQSHPLFALRRMHGRNEAHFSLHFICLKNSFFC